jgi:hypothetical protein
VYENCSRNSNDGRRSFIRCAISSVVSPGPYEKSCLPTPFKEKQLRIYTTDTHEESPEMCDRMSLMLAFSVAQSSMSSQCFGRISFTLVCQSNTGTLDGREVVFLPFAKSSIKIPTALDRNALEQEAT